MNELPVNHVKGFSIFVEPGLIGISVFKTRELSSGYPNHEVTNVSIHSVRRVYRAMEKMIEDKPDLRMVGLK